MRQILGMLCDCTVRGDAHVGLCVHAVSFICRTRHMPWIEGTGPAFWLSFPKELVMAFQGSSICYPALCFQLFSRSHNAFIRRGGGHCKLFWPSFIHIPDCKTKEEFYTVFYLGGGDLIVCKIRYFVSAVHAHKTAFSSLVLSVAATMNWLAWYFQLHLDWCMHIFVYAWYYT